MRKGSVGLLLAGAAVVLSSVLSFFSSETSAPQKSLSLSDTTRLADSACPLPLKGKEHDEILFIGCGGYLN